MKAFYYFIVLSIAMLTACGGGGSGAGGNGSNNSPSFSATSSSTSSIQSSSLQSQSSQASITSLNAPQNPVAIAADASVNLSWNSVSGATAYNIYYATEPNIMFKSISTFQNGASVKNVTSPYIISGLQNNKTYYFVVTAVKNTDESAASAEVNATPTAESGARQPTPQETLVVELINRARFDPTAEATRYGIGLNDGITETVISTDKKQPLAHNLFLIDSARKHSRWMLDTDIFSHTGIAGSTPTERMMAAGYIFSGSWSSGENIAWSGTTGSSINLTQYALQHHEGLFKSPGHRLNILNGNFREIGVGQKQGDFTYNNQIYLSSMLTENFARSGVNFYLTGVVYDDKNSNKFYDVGEGLDRVTISINGKSYPVYASGAYAIPLANGIYDLVINGASLGSTLNYRIQIMDANLKLDVLKTGSSASVVTW